MFSVKSGLVQYCCRVIFCVLLSDAQSPGLRLAPRFGSAVCLQVHWHDKLRAWVRR